MTENDQKEQYSYAYIRAVAAVAGFTVYVPEVDDDSVDLGLAQRGGGGTMRSPRLEMQVKCTGVGEVTSDQLSYPLKLKNYDDLRLEDYLVPRILVVVTVPADLSNWITQTNTELSLRHCGYWTSLRGQPAYTGAAADTKVTVHLPRDHVFSVHAVKELMGIVANGGTP